MDENATKPRFELDSDGDLMCRLADGQLACAFTIGGSSAGSEAVAVARWAVEAQPINDDAEARRLCGMWSHSAYTELRNLRDKLAAEAASQTKPELLGGFYISGDECLRFRMPGQTSNGRCAFGWSFYDVNSERGRAMRELAGWFVQTQPHANNEEAIALCDVSGNETAFNAAQRFRGAYEERAKPKKPDGIFAVVGTLGHDRWLKYGPADADQDGDNFNTVFYMPNNEQADRLPLAQWFADNQPHATDAEANALVEAWPNDAAYSACVAFRAAYEARNGVKADQPETDTTPSPAPEPARYFAVDDMGNLRGTTSTGESLHMFDLDICGANGRALADWFVEQQPEMSDDDMGRLSRTNGSRESYHLMQEWRERFDRDNAAQQAPVNAQPSAAEVPAGSFEYNSWNQLYALFDGERCFLFDSDFVKPRDEAEELARWFVETRPSLSREKVAEIERINGSRSRYPVIKEWADNYKASLSPAKGKFIRRTDGWIAYQTLEGREVLGFDGKHDGRESVVAALLNNQPHTNDQEGVRACDCAAHTSFARCKEIAQRAMTVAAPPAETPRRIFMIEDDGLWFGVNSSDSAAVFGWQPTDKAHYRELADWLVANQPHANDEEALAIVHIPDNDRAYEAALALRQRHEAPATKGAWSLIDDGDRWLCFNPADRDLGRNILAFPINKPEAAAAERTSLAEWMIANQPHADDREAIVATRGSTTNAFDQISALRERYEAANRPPTACACNVTIVNNHCVPAAEEQFADAVAQLNADQPFYTARPSKTGRAIISITIDPKDVQRTARIYDVIARLRAEDYTVTHEEA